VAGFYSYTADANEQISAAKWSQALVLCPARWRGGRIRKRDLDGLYLAIHYARGGGGACNTVSEAIPSKTAACHFVDFLATRRHACHHQLVAYPPTLRKGIFAGDAAQHSSSSNQWPGLCVLFSCLSVFALPSAALYLYLPPLSRDRAKKANRA
jgi:hypothetical protein